MQNKGRDIVVQMIENKIQRDALDNYYKEMSKLWMKNVVGQQGKSHKTALLIRLIIDERGLPRRNFVLAKNDCMVAWDSETGEVKTLAYEVNLTEYNEFWYEELNEAKKVVEWIDTCDRYRLDK